MRIPLMILMAGSALALGGCAYGDLGLGMGYGSPYGTYGSYGYGSPYGYSGYGGYGGYGSYGSMYGSGYGYGSPYGWYDNYYYPGSGYYVYDSYRRPVVMTTAQRQYWSTRSPALRTTTATRTTVRPNWSGFTRQTAATRQTARATRQATRQTAREERQQARENRPRNHY